MANEEQKKNQNGRSVFVISNEDIQKGIQRSENLQDFIEYVTTGAKLVEKNNFSWGLLHSKNTPAWSIDRIKKAKNFRFYEVNPNTGQIFRGNQHISTTNIGKASEKLSKYGDRVGKITDGVELFVAIKNNDPKTLSKKSSELVLAKAGETAGLALAGKCTSFAVKRIDPRYIAIAGVACYAAAVYTLEKAGEATGSVVGETETGEEIAKAVIQAIEYQSKMDAIAEEKRKQREYEKDPMTKWHIKYAD